MRPILLFVFAILFQTTTAQQQWEVTELANMPEGVANNAVVAGEVNGSPYIYSFSGIDQTKIFSGIHLKSWRYDINGNTWESIPDLPDDLGKIAAGASRIGDIIYIIGGYNVFSNGSETSSEKVHRYDMNSNSYLADGAPIPVPIDDHVQCVWRDSLIYVITGWSNNGNVPALQIYDPSQDVWSMDLELPNVGLYKSFGASGSIIGDTIYYFGGARDNGNFNIQEYVRKGVINPDEPTDITWTNFNFTTSTVGYRMAATTVENTICWIGGSGVTYNYNGIAYNGSGGVEPLNRSLCLVPSTAQWDVDFTNTLPMDLRGIAEVGPTTRYLAGGMETGQLVSNKLLRLEWLSPVILDLKERKNADFINAISPNPTNGKVWIELKNRDEKLSLELYSVQGKLMLRMEEVNGIVELDLSGYVSGSYYLLIGSAERWGVKKIVRF